jgi:hypothetical protein
MALDLAHEIWSELKRHIPTVDRSDAAETVVNVMIDNGFEITEIRDAFTKDTDIKRILSAYIDDIDTEENEDFDDDDQY